MGRRLLQRDAGRHGLESLCSVVLVGLLMAGLVGCGGGGGGAARSDDVTVLGQTRFLLDFVKNTVTVVDETGAPVAGAATSGGGVSAQFVERNPGLPISELAVFLRIEPEGISQPGNVGRRHIWAEVKNNSSGSMGTTDSGGSAVIELNFTNTIFQDGAGAAVAGGGYAREDAFDPPTGTPIYYFSSLGSGSTSSEHQVDMWLPVGATQAVATAILRAHSARFNPVSLSRFWVSTVAGESGHLGYVDSVNWTALFGSHASFQGMAFRESAGDVLVAEPNFNVIRLGGGNPVTHNPEVFTTAGDGNPNNLAMPLDLAMEVVGGCWVSEYNGGCLSRFSPGYSRTTSPPVLVGQRGNPGDAIGTGDEARLDHPMGVGMGFNELYVCDQDGHKLKKVTTDIPGATWSSAYRVENVPMPGLTQPVDICVDKLGNRYVADRAARSIFTSPRRRQGWYRIAGTGVAGAADGVGDAATFQMLGPIVVDAGGILWVVDNGKLRRIKPLGGDPVLPASWRVDTLPMAAAAAAAVDGPDGVATRRAIRGVCVSRGGVVGFMDDGALRRVDMTRD